MSKYKLIIFDFDGTLVDTAPDIALHANRVLNEFGYPSHGIEEVKRAVGRGVHELLKGLNEGFIADAAKLETAVKLFKQNYLDEPVIFSKPYPGVKETLIGPLSGLKKAIVTNKPDQLTKKILGELSLASYFDMVIGLDSGYPAKPDPTSTQQVMKMLNASPNEVIFIGDSKVDDETCRNAGVDFGWVDYGYDELDGSVPVMKFSNPAEWKVLGAK